MMEQRLLELETMARDSIQELRAYGGECENPALAFWRGVKAAVDELKPALPAGDTESK